MEHLYSILLLPLFTLPCVIVGQPVITSQPWAQAAARGTSATFLVGAKGSMPFTYQWSRDAGHGEFIEVPGATNASLTLDSVQTGHIGNYRVAVSNSAGAVTSRPAPLYVLNFPATGATTFTDNFDDQKRTGWSLSTFGAGSCSIAETNGLLTVFGAWPGVRTVNPWDTLAEAFTSKNWSLAEGQTIEFRVELVSLSANATNAAGYEVWGDGANYILQAGSNWVRIAKASGTLGSVAFSYEELPVAKTNILLAFALTRATPNLILTARLLDPANGNAVLHEHSVVDTPDADPSISRAEFAKLAHMDFSAGVDMAGRPPYSGSGIAIGVWEYSDGRQPQVEAAYDSFEIRTYQSVFAFGLLPPSRSGADVRVSWQSLPGVSYRLERSTNLAALPPFQVLVTNLVGQAGLTFFTDANAANSTCLFYRVGMGN